MKKIASFVILCFLTFHLGMTSSILVSHASESGPRVNCIGLPGCADTNITEPMPYTPGEEGNIALQWVGNIISQFIQYVAVIAVISLMMSGILYLISGGEEEKVNKAKSAIIWSLVGVVLSISAWGIINLLDTLSIT